MTRNLALLAFLALVGAALPGWSAPDELQRQLIQRVMEGKQKLAQAERAKDEERQRLMGEHMQIMRSALEQMRAAKPRAGMTPEQQSDWIAEHQRLMDQVMEQMMVEYSLLMQQMRH